jgi:hypothetical protein
MLNVAILFDFILSKSIMLKSVSGSMRETYMMKKRTLLMVAVAATVTGMGCETPRRRPLPPPPPQYRAQPMGLPDIKMLAKSGVSDEVILSQIRNSHSVYRLGAAEILDLKDAGVSEKVIDFMINTPSLYGSPRPPPPPPSY